MDSTDAISKLFDTGSSDVKVSNFKEHETPNYKFVPEPEFGGMRILVNGQSAGGSYERVWSDEELKQGYLNN